MPSECGARQEAARDIWYRPAMAVTWRRPRIRWVLLPIWLLVITVVIGGLPVYVRPQVDPLRHADAILVLGGKGFSRYPFGIDLGLQGWAPNVILSNPGTDNEWLTKECNTPHSRIELDCFVPDPPTTLGEGRELRRFLSERYRWRRVIVVGLSRRTFLGLGSFCSAASGGEIIMVASPTHISLREWPVEYRLPDRGLHTGGSATGLLKANVARAHSVGPTTCDRRKA